MANGLSPAGGEIRRGERGYLPFDGILRHALSEQLAGRRSYRLGPSDFDRLLGCWRALPPWPDVVAGLDRLRSHVMLVSLSNADIATSAAIADHAALGFDLILGAEPVGTYKPDPAVYLHAAEVMSLRPDEVMMVAAHNRDLEAAADLGFRTGFVRRRHEFGPGQQSDLVPTRNWDAIGDSLPELARGLVPAGSAIPPPPPGSPSPATALAASPRPGEMSRLQIIAVAVVVAVCSAMAFGQGYRTGAALGGQESSTIGP